MSGKIPIGVNVETGKAAYLDLDFLIDQKMQILGNSRSGKSRGGRTVAEKANGKMHQIIISPKREFVTLREKFDYIHVGRSSEISKPDIELNTRYAEQLALDIMKVGMDVIIEFSETPKDRIKFGRLFAEGLMQVPQQYWHPTMIIWDEIDIWAPEKGHGEAESLGAIVDLAARGGDKGYCLVAITQKLSKFNKDVASELNIKFVGNVSLDTDQTRAADELGISRKDKRILATLGRPNYHFFAYGPGISDEVIKIKFDDPLTTHIPGWKLNKNQKPIPTPAKVKEIISQFSDLPAEAEKELKTKEDLNNKIKELTVRINQLQKEKSLAVSSTPKTDPAALQKAEQIGYQKGIKEAEKQFTKFDSNIKMILRTVKPLFEKSNVAIEKELASLAKKAEELDQLAQSKIGLKLPTETKLPTTPIMLKCPPEKQDELKQTISKMEFSKAIILGNQNNGNLTGPESKILVALVQRPSHQGSRSQVAIIAGYSPKGSAFRNPLAHLKSMGYLQYTGDDLVATAEGIAAVDNVEPMPADNVSVQQFWLGHLPGPEQKILRPIITAYPEKIARDACATEAGYSAQGSAFRNPLSHLRAIGLVEYIGDDLRATKELFPE